MKQKKTNEKQTSHKTLEKREKFLELYAAAPPGTNQESIAKQAGVGWGTVRDWARQDADFAAEMDRIDDERRSLATALVLSEIEAVIQFQIRIAKGEMEDPPTEEHLAQLDEHQQNALLHAYRDRQRYRLSLAVPAARNLLDVAGMMKRGPLVENNISGGGFGALPNTAEGLQKERAELKVLKGRAIDRWKREMQEEKKAASDVDSD